MDTRLSIHAGLSPLPSGSSSLRGKRVQRLLPVLMTGAVLLAGCDGAGSVADEECGGTGVLCDVSGVATEAGLAGDGGPAVQARHYWPMDVTVGKSGEVYILDWNNHCVRKVDESGTIDRFIGAGTLGDESTGLATEINLNHPTGLTIGPDGNYYLSAWHNWKIKLIDASTMQTSAIAGSIQGFAGDGGPASNAMMDLPSSLVFGPDGSMYISDQGNQRIRRIDPQGIITTLAGSTKGFKDGVGEEAQFSTPRGPDAGPGGKIAIDPDGKYLYMADTENHRIRRIEIATKAVTTIAGTGNAGYAGDGGAASSASFNMPTDVLVTHDHEIYVADSGNNVVRRIDASGNVTTVVGTGEAGFSPDGTDARAAKLNRPHGIAYDEASHTLYIADTFNQQVKRVLLDH